MSHSKEFIVNFASGAVSGSMCSTLFQPFDLIKTRLQLNPIALSIGQGNAVRTAAHVIQAERLWGLWRGTMPSITRCVPGIGLYFGCVHTLKSAYGKSDRDLKMYETLSLGFLSRSLVSMSVMPASVLKTRYESGAFAYTSQWGAVRNIATHEGLRGLYRGSAATVLRDAPFSGLYLAFYIKSKQAMLTHLDRVELTAVHNLVCGVTAATAAAVATQPADVVRTHQQVERARARGGLEVVAGILRSKGAAGLFQGVSLRLMRRSCMAAFTWTTYEELVKFMRLAVDP